MKKYAAAVMLSALLLTACGTDTGGKEQSQTVSASEETTLTSETEETTSSVSRTKEEEDEYSRMMGTANCVVGNNPVSVEGDPTLGYYTTAARTEAVTSVSEVTSDEAYAADQTSLIGTWYVINNDLGDIAYTFEKDGTVSFSNAGENEVGTYTVKNGLLEVTLDDGDESYINSLAAIIDGDALVLDIIGLNTELIRDEYVPYTADISIYEYCKEQAPSGYPTFLSKERSVLAEQADILGEWEVFEDGEYTGNCIFTEDGITHNGESMPAVFKDGKPVSLSGGASPSAETVVYLCGERLYDFSSRYPMIFERAE